MMIPLPTSISCARKHWVDPIQLTASCVIMRFVLASRLSPLASCVISFCGDGAPAAALVLSQQLQSTVLGQNATIQCISSDIMHAERPRIHVDGVRYAESKRTAGSPIESTEGSADGGRRVVAAGCGGGGVGCLFCFLVRIDRLLFCVFSRGALHPSFAHTFVLNVDRAFAAPQRLARPMI